MPFRLPRNFGSRFEEIFQAYVLAVEDDDIPARPAAGPGPDPVVPEQDRAGELARKIHLSHVLEFLAWARQDPDQDSLADILADAESRDRAVGFYKRVLFARALEPGQINLVLMSLARFYTWWGLGEHTVAYLPLQHPPELPPA